MLSAPDRTLVRLFAAIVTGRWEEVLRIRDAEDAEPRWREAVLQAHLFAGFPRTVEAFEYLHDVLPDAPMPKAEGGAVLFDTIYGELADSVRARLHGFDPDFGRWITEHAYGRVLARGGLSADKRELLAVAALAVTDQERQLMSHVRGAVRCGAQPGEVEATIEVVVDWLEDPERVRAVVRRFLMS